MPGRRNYAREQAQHAIDAPRKQAELYDLLRSQLPDRDRALIGFPAIIDELSRLSVRRLNGGRLTDRILRRWARDEDFPLLRGNRHPTHRIAPVSSSYAILAWTLSRFCNGHLFQVTVAGGLTPRVSFATLLERERAVT